MIRATIGFALCVMAGPSASQDWLASMPSTQTAMIAAVKAGADSYTGVGSDLQRGSARPIRAKELCKAIKARRADQWIGRLKTVSTNSDGWGVVVVSITPQISIGTMPNALADIRDKTLINPKTALYSDAAKLKEGDIVVFSGIFAKGDADCLGEKSLTMSGAMMRPEFVLRFSKISKFEPPAPKPKT